MLHGVVRADDSTGQACTEDVFNQAKSDRRILVGQPLYADAATAGAATGAAAGAATVSDAG